MVQHIDRFLISDFNIQYLNVFVFLGRWTLCTTTIAHCGKGGSHMGGIRVKGIKEKINNLPHATSFGNKKNKTVVGALSLSDLIIGVNG